MSTAAAGDEIRVADRLAAIQSAEELHHVMCVLAADPMCRWTRTQVLFYLPDEMHRAADDYFVNERIVIPRRERVQVESFDAIDLDEALAPFRAMSRSNNRDNPDDAPDLPRVSPLDELVTDPPPRRERRNWERTCRDSGRSQDG